MPQSPHRFAVYRATPTLPSQLQEKIEHLSDSLRVYPDSKLHLFTLSDIAKLAQENDGYRAVKMHMVAGRDMLPQTRTVYLGEAALFETERPTATGPRFVGFRLDYQTGKEVIEERALLLQGLNRATLKKRYDPHLTLARTEDHEVALAAVETLNLGWSPEERLAITFDKIRAA